MPSSLAFSSAPSVILTKNGLLSVLVISPTISAAMAGTAPAMANMATPRANDLRVDVTKTSLTLFGAILNQSKTMLLEQMRLRLPACGGTPMSLGLSSHNWRVLVNVRIDWGCLTSQAGFRIAPVFNLQTRQRLA